MSDDLTPSPRPVSVVAVVALLVLLSLFGYAADRIYLRTRAAAPQNEAADNLNKDSAWRATPASRRQYLAELRQKQSAQAAAYGWVDQKNGVVQLPIDRAVELVIQEHAGTP